MQNPDRYRKILKEKLEWGPLATFVPNKNTPIYNWFYYKEGFSRGLVLKLLEQFRLGEGETVLDPFCGSGTTLLACKENGINSIGFDAMPVSVFASQVKTAEYRPAQLEYWANEVFAEKFTKLKRMMPPNIQRFFSPYAMDDIEFFRNRLNLVESPGAKAFLTLALIRTAMRISYAWKDGGVLKVRKHPVPPFRKFYQRTVKRMIRDVKKHQIGKGKAIAMLGDARKMKLRDGSVDAVITSPPYINNIDYTKVYMIENWFAGASMPPMRSYLGLKDSVHESVLEEHYFQDMGRVLKEMYRVIRPGGKAGIVVGNAYLQDRIAEVDLMLAGMAEDTGFRARKILCLNKRFALKRRTVKVGVLRESLVVLEK